MHHSCPLTEWHLHASQLFALETAAARLSAASLKTVGGQQKFCRRHSLGLFHRPVQAGMPGSVTGELGPEGQSELPAGQRGAPSHSCPGWWLPG